MTAVAEKLTSERFRKIYAQRKPYFELLDGHAVQKLLPAKLHSVLQFVLSLMLKELGFKSRPELTLAISESWEPTPDVCGIIGPEEDPYPTHLLPSKSSRRMTDSHGLSRNAASMRTGELRTFWFSTLLAVTLGTGTGLQGI